jgi:hypothetical protein
VLFEAGKNPTDFDFVEFQDILNYETQQAIRAIVSCGFIDEGFKVFPDSPLSNNTVLIKKGEGWLQDATGVGGIEYSGIRVKLPDVLKTTPSTVYEHILDVASTYERFTIVATIPPATPYRYDLLYVIFKRKTYTPTDDIDIQDSTLGETSQREKWYYEFRYYEGNDSNKNPSIPSLGAGEYGVKLAILVRHASDNVTSDVIIDMRPKFSINGNLMGDNLILVGTRGGKYPSIKDVVNNFTTSNPITPTATNPYTLYMLPGVHSITAINPDGLVPQPIPLDLSTLSVDHVRIIGAGVDKTILEFSDPLALLPDNWIKVGSSTKVEFADMTIRVNLTNSPVPYYTEDNYIIKINGGTVKFTNCKIGGDINTNVLFGCMDIVNGTVTLNGCELYSRSTTIPALHIDATSTVKIQDSIMKQSGGNVIKDEGLINSFLRIYDSEITGNAFPLYLNSPAELHDCIISKADWLSDGGLTADECIHTYASSVKLYSCKITATSGVDKIIIQPDGELHDCYHDGTLQNDNIGTMKVFNSTLTTITVSNSATPEFYGCDILDAVTLTGASTVAKFTGCLFKKVDAAVITGTSVSFELLGCSLATTGAVKVIDLLGTCVPIIQGCKFYLNNAGATGIYLEANTATPIASHCTANGNGSAKIFDAAVATTIKAGDIDGDVTLKGANVTITDIRLA